MKRALFRTVLILLNCHFVTLQQPQCLLMTDENGPPSFPNASDYPNGYGAIGQEITRQQQAIFASYKLNCCGNITKWGIDVTSGAFQGRNDRSGHYSLDFQVWRPSPTVDNSTDTGCYSLVGSNRFRAISPIISPGVAIVTPSPQDYISFQPGDVLGVFVEDAFDNRDGVVVLTHSTFTSGIVWYANIEPTMTTSRNGDCPYSVGSNGILNTFTHGAPVISIQTNQYSCPDSWPGPGRSGLSGETVIIVAVAVTALAVTFIATVVMIGIVLRLKRGTNLKQDVSNPAQYGSKSHEQAEPAANNNCDHIHGVTLTVTSQDTHTGDESAYYDYPAVDQNDTQCHVDETRMNIAYGINDRDTTTGDSTGGYSYPAAVDQTFQAGPDDKIEAERNEAYAANIAMDKNEAYKSATAVEKGTASDAYYDYIK